MGSPGPTVSEWCEGERGGLDGLPGWASWAGSGRLGGSVRWVSAQFASSPFFFFFYPFLFLFSVFKLCYLVFIPFE